MMINPVQMTLLRADMSQYYALKATIEQLFGHAAYAELKECTSLAIWKRHVNKLFNSIKISVHETVEIADETWFEDLDENIALGKEHVKLAKSVDELFAALSAILARLVFLQLGYLPQRSDSEEVTLAKSYWKLIPERTVQYVQNRSQKQYAEKKTKRRTQQAPSADL
jgi:hypothetical protein